MGHSGDVLLADEVTRQVLCSQIYIRPGNTWLHCVFKLYLKRNGMKTVVLTLALVKLAACKFSPERYHLSERLMASKHLRLGHNELPRLHSERALVHRGSLSPMARFAERWFRGQEPLTVSVIGGSVCVGHGCVNCSRAPDFFNTWSRRVYDALVEHRPGNASMKYRNGAIPSTGSAYFSSCLDYRVPEDTSIVFLEFAINGGGLAGIEGVVRKLLSRSQPPALVLVDWYQY